MQEGAKRLIGLHNFRHFCKQDDSKNVNGEAQVFERTIRQITFDQVFSGFGLNMYVCNIKGSAFLWHQIRYTMAILFMIGEGEESPSIIDTMLSSHDVNYPIFP